MPQMQRIFQILVVWEILYLLLLLLRNSLCMYVCMCVSVSTLELFNRSQYVCVSSVGV